MFTNGLTVPTRNSGQSERDIFDFDVEGGWGKNIQSAP
ncbi:hypothetical protein CCC_01382 [Paramagnetospirillum magnetotacticum MS-1]|uniref:Uncharacterized protein n=1 Tax=Paramagnetospirillum magnetotacticum MS-1 TaxID=272627 RepID=A0A0C2YAV1_PARME|nr:hypothetical protein CCC_01382 [Paramagnetospirillum magnetotacticum MS-1]